MKRRAKVVRAKIYAHLGRVELNTTRGALDGMGDHGAAVRIVPEARYRELLAAERRAKAKPLTVDEQWHEWAAARGLK